MSNPIYLFCGGPAIYGNGLPKPLMRIQGGRSLLVHFLLYVQHYRLDMPESVTILCDDGQEAAFEADLRGFLYPVPIRILACGKQPSTFEKLFFALQESADGKKILHFGYPDIFSLEKINQPLREAPKSDTQVCISAAALTSRFPQLIVDVFNNKVRGISNYSSSVPANPMYVFGGDLWGRSDILLALVKEFQHQSTNAPPTLEYDFFFWLINQRKMNCAVLPGEQLWVDSVRDVNRLLAVTGPLP